MTTDQAADQLTIETLRVDACVRVSAHGEIDVSTVGLLREVLLNEIKAGEGTWVQVDLSGVSFMDSTGLGVLIAAHRRLTATGGKLTIHKPSRPVLRVLQVSGLDRLLTVAVASAERPRAGGQPASSAAASTRDD